MAKEKCDTKLIQRDPKCKAKLCVKPQTKMLAKNKKSVRKAKLRKAINDTLGKGKVVHSDKLDLHTDEVADKVVKKKIIQKYDPQPIPLPPHVCEELGIPSYSYPARAYPPYCFGAHNPPVLNGGPSLTLHRVTASGPSQYGVVPHALASQGSTTHGMPSDEVRVKAPPLRFPGVFVHGLHWSSRADDIRRFFKGLKLVDVFLVFTIKSFSGEAFVVFSDMTFAGRALQRDGMKMMGNTVVRVLPCNKQDYYNAVAAALDDALDSSNSQAHTKPPTNNKLKEQTHVSKSSVLADVSYPECILGPATSLHDNITDPGRPEGEAKCLIEKDKGNCNDVAAAVVANDCLKSINSQAQTKVPKSNAMADASFSEHPQGRTASLCDNNMDHRQTEDETKSLLNKDKAKPKHKKIAKCPSDKDHPILRVCGPPYFADKNVITNVFWELDLSDDRIHIVLHPDGKPTGEMFLEFISLEDTKKALLRDKTMIGSHQLKILPATVDDLPVKSTERKQELVCHDSVKESNNEPKLPYGHDSMKKPNNELELTDSSHISAKKSDDEPKLPGSRLQCKPKISDDLQAGNTKVIKMRNVPPSADKYDIIDLFGEFKLSPERLHVACGQNGIATGVVFVEFNSAEDAKKALSKHRHKIHSQCVFLFLSSKEEVMQAMNGKW